MLRCVPARISAVTHARPAMTPLPISARSGDGGTSDEP